MRKKPPSKIMSAKSRGDQAWEASGETVSRRACDRCTFRRGPISEVRADVPDGTGARQRRGQCDEGARWGGKDGRWGAAVWASISRDLVKSGLL